MIVVAMAVLLMVGCAGRAKPGTAQHDKTYLTHTVKYSGETLGSISSWYTGNSNNWKTIQSHNKGLNVNRIRVGNKIYIPRALVRRTQPLPESVGTGKMTVAQALAAQSSTTTAAAESAQVEEYVFTEIPATEAAAPATETASTEAPVTTTETAASSDAVTTAAETTTTTTTTVTETTQAAAVEVPAPVAVTEEAAKPVAETPAAEKATDVAAAPAHSETVTQ